MGGRALLSQEFNTEKAKKKRVEGCCKQPASLGEKIFNLQAA